METRDFSRVRLHKKTICRYTGKMLSNGRRLHEYDKVEVKDADGNKIPGIVRFGAYQSSFDNTATAHIGFYVDWQDNWYWRKDLGYWVNSERTETIGNIQEK